MEVTIGSKVYRTGKLDAFKQLHIARRLAPILTAMGSLAGLNFEQIGNSDFSKPEVAGKLLIMLKPIVDVIGSLPDADCDYVIKTALSACECKEGDDKWAKVMVNGQLMYQSGPKAIDLKEMLQLTAAVIRENLGSFFPDEQPEKSLSA